MNICENLAILRYLGGRVNWGGGWLGGGGEGPRGGGLTTQEASKTENDAHVRCQRIPPWKWVPRCTESTSVQLLRQYHWYNDLYCHWCNNSDNDVTIVVVLAFQTFSYFLGRRHSKTAHRPRIRGSSRVPTLSVRCLSCLFFPVLCCVFSCLRFPQFSQRCTSRKLEKLRSSREVRFFSRSKGSKSPRKFEIIMRICENLAILWYSGGRVNWGLRMIKGRGRRS